MSSSERLSIPLLSKLVPAGFKFGTMLAVEFDPESQWFGTAATITAQHIRSGNMAYYLAMSRPREEVREYLGSIGLNVNANEEGGLLQVDDWYTASLGLERMASDTYLKLSKYNIVKSLKVADLSVEFLKWAKEKDPNMIGPPRTLYLAESLSLLMRFNEEKAFLEWFENRTLPWEKMTKRVALFGFVRGIHSESLYKRVENAVDGVIDVKVMERDDKVKSLLRMRSLKGQPCDTSWHEIELKPTGEASLSG